MTTHQDKAGRVWLITGCSAGFGRAIADAALARGDRVVATARRPEALADLAGERALVVALDVTHQDEIDAAVDAALERFGGIDVLVNNAGYGSVGAVEEIEMDDLRALMEALQAEVAPLGIRTLIVEPGSFRTEFGGARMHYSPEIDAYADTVGPTRAFLAGADGTQPGDPRKAAAAILATLDASEPPLRLALGADAVDAIRAKHERLRGDLDGWEAVSRDTAHEDAEP
jgi:NAD(P)-dependent dehydrogenase (short-subunit alcohol dehydrogenase family)